MNIKPPYQQPIHDARNFFRQKSVLTYLVSVNIAVWLLVQIIQVLAFLFKKPGSVFEIASIIDYIAVPAFIPTLIQQPWSLLTYMFLHISIWHILFNMLWLYWFGRIFLEYLTGRKLIVVYLLGGLAGAAVYILSFNVFPVFSSQIELAYALGASASVMAIVTSTAIYVPNYTIYLLFFGRVKILYLAIILFVFDFFMIPSGNAGGHIAHIGGAILGFMYIKLLPREKSMHASRGSFIYRLFRFFVPGKPTTKTKKKAHRPLSDEEFNFQKAQQQKRIDQILEKISKGGYDSLTREEKEFLFKTSGKR